MPTEKKKKWRRIIESAIQRTTHNAHIICDRTDIHVWHFFFFCFIGRSVNTFGDSSLTSTSHFFLFIYLFFGISVPQSSSTFTVVSTQPMTSKNIKINRKTKKKECWRQFHNCICIVRYSGLISLSLFTTQYWEDRWLLQCHWNKYSNIFFFIWIGTEVQWMLLTIFRKCNLICVQTANKNTSYTINDQYTYYICIIKWIVCLLNLFSWNNFTRFQCHFSQSIRKNGSYIDIIFVCTNEWCPLWLDKHCPKAIFVANRVANGHIDFCVQTIIAHHLRC